MAGIARSRLAAMIIEQPTKVMIRRVAAHMVHTKRSKQIDLLIKDVEKQAAKNGTVVAHIQAAHEATDTTTTKIKKMVQDMEPNAKKIELDTTIDSSLLGGVVITTPEKELDLSLRTRLNRLKLQ